MKDACSHKCGGAWMMVDVVRLTIEMIPRSMWCENCRSFLPYEIWRKVAKDVRKKAGNRCEVCEIKASLECHEVFDWLIDHQDDIMLTTGTQRLVRLQALCPLCHAVKHIGRIQDGAEYQAAFLHLSIVNRWTFEETKRYVEESFRRVKQLDSVTWTQDFSVLNQYVDKYVGGKR